MTLDEFLALPETEPASEFICGEVIQKAMPTGNHGTLAAELGALLRNHLRSTKAGRVMIETRYAARKEGRSYLPDVGVVLRVRMSVDRAEMKSGAIEYIPDLAIEILSPDDRPSRVAEKLAFYTRNEIPLVWVVDPDERTIDAYRPGRPTTRHTADDVITGEPVLPDFRLDVGALFAVLDE